MPGQEYRIDHSRDVLGYIDGDVKLVVNRAARCVGVESEDVYRVLETYERRLVSWWTSMTLAEGV
jgi:hypothetical protein